MFGRLMDSIMHASLQGWVGVSLIFIYFAIMISLIAYRIKKGDHVNHH